MKVLNGNTEGNTNKKRWTYNKQKEEAAAITTTKATTSSTTTTRSRRTAIGFFKSQCNIYGFYNQSILITANIY